MLAAAKLILAILCGSYLLSAAILGVMRYRGEVVPWWVIGGWLVTGGVGLALLPLVSPHRLWTTVLVTLALGPWMIVALVGDVRAHHYVIAAIDIAGLGAIAYAAWLLR